MASDARESPDPVCFSEVSSPNLSNFEDDASPLQWVRSCAELPGVARGWVTLSSPTHSTMLYSMMQEGMASHQVGAMVGHGQASTEQT